MKDRLALGLVCTLCALADLDCSRERKPVWTREPDGFEHSYVEPEGRGPIYVRRKVLPDGCLFGDYPEEGESADVRVKCGETWHGNLGETLACTCTAGQ